MSEKEEILIEVLQFYAGEIAASTINDIKNKTKSIKCTEMLYPEKYVLEEIVKI